MIASCSTLWTFETRSSTLFCYRAEYHELVESSPAPDSPNTLNPKRLSNAAPVRIAMRKEGYAGT